LIRRRLRIAVFVTTVAVGLLATWAFLPLGHASLDCGPSDNPQCREAAGRVLYVEAVDPDGDGAMHLVLASRQSRTWPGVTVLAIPRAERPSSPPHFGQWVSAVGLPNIGSHGEATLNALRFEIR
jgi:hypothetical protein